PFTTADGSYLKETTTVRFSAPALPGQGDGAPGLNTRTDFSVPSRPSSVESPCMYDWPDGVSKYAPQMVGPLGNEPPPPPTMGPVVGGGVVPPADGTTVGTRLPDPDGEGRIPDADVLGFGDTPPGNAAACAACAYCRPGLVSGLE